MARKGEKRGGLRQYGMNGVEWRG
jgi:hypothetical protein